MCVFFQAEDGIRDLVRSRGLGDVYKRQGGVRTALYNYLFARKHGGQFLVRIEDTDRTRFVPGAEDYIREALAWCGMKPDEGPWDGGPDGPYRQSDRKHLYRDYAEKLVQDDKAYYAFDTTEDLDAMRERLKAAGVAAPAYNAVTRCLLYTSDAADERSSVDLGGRRII